MVSEATTSLFFSLSLFVQSCMSCEQFTIYERCNWLETTHNDDVEEEGKNREMIDDDVVRTLCGFDGAVDRTDFACRVVLALCGRASDTRRTNKLRERERRRRRHEQAEKERAH